MKCSFNFGLFNFFLLDLFQTVDLEKAVDLFTLLVNLVEGMNNPFTSDFSRFVLFHGREIFFFSMIVLTCVNSNKSLDN